MTRAARIARYPHRLGGHCGSGAMRDLLHWNGLGWGGPPDEGLVFTLGGALGLSYLRSADLMPPVYLVGRGGDFELDLPRRLGGEAYTDTTDDPALGWSWVRDEIDAGRPALVWGDIGELPYLRVQLSMSRHDIVIIGYDLDTDVALVVDNDRADVQEVPLAALARARSSVAFPQPTRHCIYRITWPDELPDLAQAAASAFEQSAANMRRPSGPGIADLAAAEVQGEGLEAADRLASDALTWNTLNPDSLEIVLFSLGAFIEKAGTGGGLFRRLLASGCADIAGITGDAATADLAAAASRSAEAWTAVARLANQRDEPAAVRVLAVAEQICELPKLELALVDSLERAAASLRRPD